MAQLSMTFGRDKTSPVRLNLVRKFFVHFTSLSLVGKQSKVITAQRVKITQLDMYDDEEEDEDEDHFEDEDSLEDEFDEGESSKHANRMEEMVNAVQDPTYVIRPSFRTMTRN